MTTALLTPSQVCSTLGQLTINGVLMHKEGAWNVLNPQILWLPTDERGSNVVISRARGRRAYPWRTDQSSYPLSLLVDGVLDWDGNPYANPWEGLETNLAYLYANVLIPPTAPTAVRAASLLMPSGETRIADVQPKHLGIPNAVENACFTDTLTLVVPDGAFFPTLTPPAPCITTNDALANATVIQPTGTGHDMLDMTDYTRERDEPNHLGDADDGTGFWASAWWTITTTVDILIDIDTIGSDFNTVLAIYSGGPAMVDLIEYYSDDDSGGGGTSALSGAFLDAGFQFWIAVAGYSGASGNAVLNWSITPA